jgi:hypothetical protein
MHKETVIIVFSKDRAFQADLLLASFERHCRDRERGKTCVLFACSNGRHRAQYERLRAMHPDVTFVAERDFDIDLRRLIDSAPHALLLVDDAIFMRPFSLTDCLQAMEHTPRAFGFSLRLSAHTCINSRYGARLRKPAFSALPNGILSFDWRRNDYDLGVAAEVSSSIYRSETLRTLMGSDPVKNPNFLEHRMQQRTHILARRLSKLLCFTDAACFCDPANIVQTDFANTCGGDPDETPSRLMELFDSGVRADPERFAGMKPHSVHLVLPLTKPFAQPQEPVRWLEDDLRAAVHTRIPSGVLSRAIAAALVGLIRLPSRRVLDAIMRRSSAHKGIT